MTEKIRALTEQNHALTEQNHALTEQNHALTEQNLALTEPKLESVETNLALTEPKLESVETNLELIEQVSTNVLLSSDEPNSDESQEMTLSPSDGDDGDDDDDDEEKPAITCSVYDGKMCISLTGELVPGDDIRLTTVGKYVSLAFANETTKTRNFKNDEIETSSEIICGCFDDVWTNIKTSDVFQPKYGKYIGDAQEDESYKDDPMYHGCYDRTASRYVIPYSLLLSFLEDDTTKSFLLHDIPKIFEDSRISEDIICSKMCGNLFRFRL